MTPASPAQEDEFQRRLTAVGTRLRDLAPRRLDGLTDPDPATGERWDAGQVWAHIAEFVPYWIAQAERVLASEFRRPGAVRPDPDQPGARGSHRAGPAPGHHPTLA